MKSSFFRWIRPFILGVVMFNILRAVTDLTRDGDFWTGSISQHIVSQLIVIGICYIYDIMWQNKLGKRKNEIIKQNSFIKEYLSIFSILFLSFNIIIIIGEKLNLLYMGNGFIDYILANLVFLPIFLLYYTILRSDIINKNYAQQALLLEKIKSQNLDTELKYLKAQYHPHFLFNALNTIYFQTKEDKARQSIELLSELLRYQLYNVNKIVTIGQEIDFIKSYTGFQLQRISKRLVFNVEYDSLLNEQQIHPLLFQPLLENAFKYVGGEYWINLNLRADEENIVFTIENAIVNLPSNQKTQSLGIGIENLMRRLELLYPNEYYFNTERKEKSFRVELIIKPLS